MKVGKHIAVLDGSGDITLNEEDDEIIGSGTFDVDHD